MGGGVCGGVKETEGKLSQEQVTVTAVRSDDCGDRGASGCDASKGASIHSLRLQSAPRECTDHIMPRQSSCPWTGLLFAVEQPLPVKEKKQGEKERERVKKDHLVLQ